MLLQEIKMFLGILHALAWVKNILWAGHVCLSVHPSICPHESTLLLEPIVEKEWDPTAPIIVQEHLKIP
jgi:hypothetical protein